MTLTPPQAYVTDQSRMKLVVLDMLPSRKYFVIKMHLNTFLYFKHPLPFSFFWGVRDFAHTYWGVKDNAQEIAGGGSQISHSLETKNIHHPS